MVTHLKSSEELIIVINLVGNFHELEAVFIGLWFQNGIHRLKSIREFHDIPPFLYA